MRINFLFSSHFSYQSFHPLFSCEWRECDGVYISFFHSLHLCSYNLQRIRKFWWFARQYPLMGFDTFLSSLLYTVSYKHTNWNCLAMKIFLLSISLDSMPAKHKKGIYTYPRFSFCCTNGSIHKIYTHYTSLLLDVGGLCWFYNIFYLNGYTAIK